MNIPASVAKCRRCAGALRLATMRKLDVIVCDDCQRFTYPPLVVVQWAADTRGNKPRLELIHAAD